MPGECSRHSSRALTPRYGRVPESTLRGIPAPLPSPLADLVWVDNEVDLHVLPLDLASLHQISHAGWGPSASLPQHRVDSAQQGTNVVLQRSEAEICCVGKEVDATVGTALSSA